MAHFVADAWLGCANRDEQMSKGWPFSLLNDEQMSNKVGVEHQPVESQIETTKTASEIWKKSKFVRINRKDLWTPPHPHQIIMETKSSWCFQPIWKICSSNWIISPGIVVKIQNIWNHHLELNSPNPPIDCHCWRIFSFPLSELSWIFTWGRGTTLEDTWGQGRILDSRG